MRQPTGGWRRGALRLLLASLPALATAAPVAGTPGPQVVRIGVSAPLSGPLAALTARVKAAFDPDGVLNPGRMGPAGGWR